MATPYTMGTWRVKEGRADEFVAAWREFAEWTAEHVEGAGRGTLLRDLEDQNKFVSFGPWASMEAIEAWRGLEGWKERVARMRELLDDFDATTLEVAAGGG